MRIIKNNGYLCLQGIDGCSFFGKNTGVSPAAEEIFMTFFVEYAIITYIAETGEGYERIL